MFFTVEKLNVRIPQIIQAAVRAVRPLEVATCAAEGAPNDVAMAPAPADSSSAWQALSVGTIWGQTPGISTDQPPALLDWGIPVHGGSTHWLRSNFVVPSEWAGKTVQLALEWKDSGQSSLEAILSIDGDVIAGVDEFHRAIILPSQYHSGDHTALLRCYVPFHQPFGGLNLVLRDDTIFRLGITMRALSEAYSTYRDSDPAAHAILSALNDAYNTLDLREGWQSERFAESAGRALSLLQERLALGSEPAEHNPAVPTPTLMGTGHAHLDTAWLWPLWRTRQKVAHTVATALHLMERYPSYYFSMSQPHVFNFLKQDDPVLYERMKEQVLAGRFEPIGMMWIEADCNLSSGESLARQLLHGHAFFAEEFGDVVGVDAPHIVWLPDVFGYSAAMPQLLRLAGIDSFMTTKISWNQFNRMPYDTFRWRGIDGSEVLTHFVTVTDQPMTHWANPQFYTYNAHMTGGEVYGTWNHYRQKDINQDLLYIYGWGDGGGGPTEEMLEAAEVFKNLPNFPQVRQGRIDQYFQELYERVWTNPRLPTWSGELYLEYHRGTYTSQANTKQGNRRAELAYRSTEWLNAWATSNGALNQQPTLDEGWRTILLNQFHDILPGSSVHSVYVENAEDYARVMQISQQVASEAINSLAQAESASVLNNLPWDRSEVVQVPFSQELASPNSQVTKTITGEQALLIDVDVPSYGYASYAPKAATGTLIVEQKLLANDLIRIEFDENGEISSLYDLRNQRQVLEIGQSLNQLVAYEDRPMNWSAWDIDAFYDEKPYAVREITDWQVVEQGPLRAAIQITRKFGQSTITQRISLAHNSAKIDFDTFVDWQERETLLRALFPLDINATRATCEIQFGAVERPTHRNTSWDWARFEVCAHRWVDLSEGGYGVALLNDSKYGHSLNHNTIGISLLKGSVHPDPEADIGTHHFTYSLLPHAGDWRAAEVVRRAYELNSPLFISEQKLGEADSASFVRCDSDHVVLETVKVAQDGDGLILRMYEAHNQRGPVTISFDRPILTARETDLLERDLHAVEVSENSLSITIKPFEIKTLRVNLV
jgi:alpha-mannosidase